MHDVGKALHVHELGDMYCSGFADPANVIAAQVHQHDVFGALLLASLQFLFVGVVLARGDAAWTGAGDGMGCGNPVLDFYHRLDGRTDDLEPIQVQIVHVGGRVDAAKGAVYLERVGISAAGEPLGVDHLDDVSGVDVLDALLNGVGVTFRREIGLYGSGAAESNAALQLRWQHQRLSEAAHHFVDPVGGVFVRSFHVAVQMGMADHLNVVAEVVEYQDGFPEHEDRFGDALGVSRHRRHPGLEVANGIVGQVADGSPVEPWEAVHRN